MNRKQALSELELSAGASAQEIKSAYRRKAMQWHPDRNPGKPEAEENFKSIQRAYETLTQAKAATATAGGHGDGASDFGFSGPSGAGSASAWSDAFEQVFGAAFHGYEQSFKFSDDDEEMAPVRAGRDIEQALSLSLRDATFGATVVFRHLGTQREVELRVPAGIETGQTLRVRGYGTPSRSGGSSGDLLLRIQVQPHPTFHREGLNLHGSLNVDFETCVLGGEAAVQLLDDSWVTVKVPDGATSGTRLRLKQKGAKKGEEQGDLYLEIKPQGPKSLTPAQKKAWANVKKAMQVSVDAPPKATRIRRAPSKKAAPDQTRGTSEGRKGKTAEAV